MTPIKNNAQYEVLEQLDDEGRDFIVQMNVSAHARKQDPSLPEVWQARLVLYPESEQPNHIKGLLTFLTNSDKYSTQCVLDVYFERLEIENSYGELKCETLDNELLLRSQSAKGVQKETCFNINNLQLITCENQSNNQGGRRLAAKALVL